MLVHRSRFVDWLPEEIESVAFSCDGSTLAVSRRHGGIELHSSSPGFSFFSCSRRIPGRGGESSARSVAWSPATEVSPLGRLFSASLSGSIVEFSPATLCAVRETPSYGGACWCVAVSPSGRTLAAACDDGAVRLFDLVDDAAGGCECLSLSRVLARRSGRLVSVAWSRSGSAVFAGGAFGSVAGWEFPSGRSILSAAVESPSTVVWSIAVCAGDSTLATADSLGKTQFWDISTGTLVQAFKEHQSDVLAVAAGDDVVFSAGVDPKLCMFQLVRGKWTCRGGLRRHTHDVKALAVHGGVVASGSVDTQVAVFTEQSFAAGQAATIISPFPSGDAIVSAGPSAKLLLARFRRSLHLWRLGSPAQSPVPRASLSTGARLPTAAGHSCLLDFDLPRSRSDLVCAAVSSAGSFLACSDAFELRVFSMSIGGPDDQAKVSLSKLALPPGIAPAYRVAFTPDEKSLIASTYGGSLAFLALSRDSISVSRVFKQKSDPVAAPPDLAFALAVSPDSLWVAAASVNSDSVRVFENSGRSPKEIAVVPALGAHFTAIAFSADSSLLALTTADCRYHVWSVAERSLTEFSKSLNSVEARALPGTDVPYAIAVNPAEPGDVYIHSVGWICRVPIVAPDARMTSDDAEADPNDVARILGRQVTPVRRYQLVLSANFVGSDELAVVERPWMHILQKLPEPLNYNRFGN